MGYATASAPRWTRRSRPNFRRKGGPRSGGVNRKRARVHSRTRGGARSRRVTRRKTEGSTSAPLQWTRLKFRTGRRVKASTLDRRLVRASREFKIFGFRQLKAFDDSGATPINSVGTGDLKVVPIQVYSLNSQIGSGGPNVARDLSFNDATNHWYWSDMVGLTGAGAPNAALQCRKESNGMLNNMRSYHEYTHIKMNCWGAKTKPIRWQIDVILPLSDEVNPFHWSSGTPMGTAAAQAWEEMVKQFTFNPIAKMDHYIKRNFRTVKSISFIIEPNSSVDGDSDPQVKTIDWFIRRNKIVNFDKVTSNVGQYTLTDGGALKSAVEVTATSATGASVHPRDRENLLLLVRASDYSAPQAWTNTLHGSYDIDFATKFTTLA